MKKEKSISKSKKLLNRLMVYLIGLLGFTAATGCPVFAYGSPHATYKYKFQLLDEKGKPLENTQLRVTWKGYNYRLLPTDPNMVTDKNGRINHSAGGFIKNYDDSWLVYYETDNEHHAGVFKEDSVIVEQKQIKKGKGTWNDGTFEVKATLKLKKK